jgi:AhpD family alkylhydroperoxidase
MELNEKMRELVAVGASITANCQPCLQIHVEKALGAGAHPDEVAAAIEMGNRVRKGAAAKMEEFASRVIQPAGAAPSAEVVFSGGGCDFLGP